MICNKQNIKYINVEDQISTIMIDKQSKEKINELVMTHLAFPVIVLLGLAITGIVIDSLLRINSTFGVLFIMVGGIPAIGSYYLSKFRKDSKT